MRESGQGMSWGRIVHRALETLSKDGGIDLEPLLENLIREEDRALAEKESLIGVVHGVLSSDLWKRSREAERVLVEVPFSQEESEGRTKVVDS